MLAGFLLSLYSTDISQETGVPAEFYWIASWIVFIVGLIIFAVAVVVQRRALQRMKSRTRDDSEALSSAIESLNEITDSLIMRSEREEEAYEKLKLDCRAHMLPPTGLDDLRAMCNKTKELAMNLLCFSLAHFKRRT